MTNRNGSEDVGRVFWGERLVDCNLTATFTHSRYTDALQASDVGSVRVPSVSWYLRRSVQNYQRARATSKASDKARAHSTFAYYGLAAKSDTRRQRRRLSAYRSCGPPLTVSFGWQKTELRLPIGCTLVPVPAKSWRSPEETELSTLTISLSFAWFRYT